MSFFETADEMYDRIAREAATRNCQDCEARAVGMMSNRFLCEACMDKQADKIAALYGSSPGLERARRG